MSDLSVRSMMGLLSILTSLIGLRLPLQPFYMRMFSYLGVAPGQLSLPGWRTLTGLHVLWLEVLKHDISVRELRGLYQFKKPKGPGIAYFSPWGDHSHIVEGNPAQWTPDCEEAFQELKGYLVNAPLLAKPEPREVLLLYIAISEHATSSVLLREDDNGVQRPIYYTSKAMVDVEKRYPTSKKIVLALVVSARKLRPYFQAHTIAVVTNLPLRQILQKLDMSGRLLRWSLELSKFDIIFKPRSAIKAQAVADFIAEFANDSSGEGDLRYMLDTPPTDEEELGDIYIYI